MTRSPHTLRRAIVALAALTWTTSAVAATQFVPQVVQSTGNVGQFASIALDSQDDPHIGYFGTTRQDLKFATKAGGAWTIDTAESTAVLGLHTSLGVTTGGDPIISYFDATLGDLKVASRSGGAWTRE